MPDDLTPRLDDDDPRDGATPDGGLRDEVRSYYDTVSRYIEAELLKRRDRAFWEEVLHPSSRAVTLELGCGTGRVTRVLASGSARVVAMDLSWEMLRRARSRFAGCGNVHLLMGDLRTLRLARTFDLVVAANDPFVHLIRDRDRDRALETVAHHLPPAGGRFVLDAFWLPEERMEEASRPGGYRRERLLEASEEAGETQETEEARTTLADENASCVEPGSLRIRETWRCEPRLRLCRVRYEYLQRGSVVDRASFRARLWSPEELERRLDRVGMEITSTWGGFDRRPFRREDAGNLIIEATKRRDTDTCLRIPTSRY